jgi:multiple sugar transport system substrate-binding protein
MRDFLRTAAALLCLLVVAGHGFAGGQTEAAGTSSALADVDPSGATVTYWYQHAGSREEALQPMIQRFNDTNEWGITVNGEYQGGYRDIYNKMITGIAGGSTPELVVAYQNQAAAYQVSDALVDLGPYVADPTWGYTEEELGDFFEGFIQQDVSAQFDGMRLGWPPNRSIEVLYYNADWLESLGISSPPSTWDAFFDAVEKATTSTSNDRYGYAVSTDASNVFAQVISRGGTITKDDGSGYVFTSDEMRDSMAFMKEIYDMGYGRKIAERYGDQTDFANRKVLFTMSSTSGLPYYEQAVAESDQGEFEWTVAPIPHTTSKPALDIYGASVSIPKSTPEQQLAAWLFLKWMSEPEQQAEWVRASNYFPVRKSTAENLDDYFQENPKYEDAFDLLMTADLKAEPPFAGYDEVRDAVSAAFNAILDGADIEETLQELEVEANEIHEDASP